MADDVTRLDVLTTEERRLLLAVADRMLDIASAPVPASDYAAARLDDLHAFGPQYRPGEWFGDGGLLSEAARVRFIRAIGRLESRGLLQVTNSGGRLRYLRLLSPAVPLLGELAAMDAGDVEMLRSIVSTQNGESITAQANDRANRYSRSIIASSLPARTAFLRTS